MFGLVGYYDPTRYPTTDGVIPAAWFVRLLATTGSSAARQQLEAATATAHGIALAMAGDKERGKVKHITDRLRREAAPLILPHDAQRS